MVRAICVFCAAWLLIGLAGALAPLVAAQEPGPVEEELPLLVPYREKVTVRLVYVPVQVRDRDGQPVLGLTRDDFTLLVDGKPVEIATFDPPLVSGEGAAAGPIETFEAAVSGEGAAAGEGSGGEQDGPAAPEPLPAAPDARAARDADQGRVSVALVVDRLSTPMRLTVRAFSSARDYLERDLPPGTEIGLFSVIRGGLRTVHPFTADRQSLLEALKKEENNFSRTEVWRSEGGDHPMATPWERVEDPGMRNMNCADITAAGIQQKRRLLSAFQGLERLGLAMADRPGRRSIVFMGYGMRLRGGWELVQGLGVQYADCVVENEPQFSRLADMLKAGNVSMTTVHLGGMRTRGDDSVVDGSLFLAEETGGMRPLFMEDFEGELTEAVAAPGRAYVLGFYADESAPGTDHRIAVNVTWPDATVLARNSWVERPPDFEARISQSALLLLPPPELSVEGGASALLRHDGRRKGVLHLLMRLPADSLRWQQGSAGRRVAHVSIAIRTLADRDRSEQVFQRPHQIVLRPDEVTPRVFVFEEILSSSKIKDTDAVLAQVRDSGSGETYTWRTEVVPIVREKSGPGRLTRPYLLAALPGARLESAPSSPVLSRRLGGTLFVPVPETGNMPGPYVLGAVWTGHPEARVQFCLTGEAGGCVPARLEPLLEEGEEETSRRGSVAAWAITSARSLAEADLWVEVRREPGRPPTRAALEEVPPVPVPVPVPEAGAGAAP